MIVVQGVPLAAETVSAFCYYRKVAISWAAMTNAFIIAYRGHQECPGNAATKINVDNRV